jgi:hypothetical protein
MDYCAVCDEATRDGLLTDDMKPVCQLCYNDARMYQDSIFSCEANIDDQRGDLRKCSSYEKSLKKLFSKLDKKKESIRYFGDDLRIHSLLYPELEPIGMKKIEIAYDVIESEVEILKRTEEVRKISCDTKNSSQLKRVEQFIGCRSEVPVDLALPLPRGEQQVVTHNYHLKSKVFKTTFDGKVLFEDRDRFNVLNQITKKNGDIGSEVFLEAPEGYEIHFISRNCIVAKQHPHTYKLYDKNKEEILTFSMPVLGSRFEYVPPLSDRPALLLIIQRMKVTCYVIDGNDMKLNWTFPVIAFSHSLFPSSLFIVSDRKTLILDVYTGEVLWERILQKNYPDSRSLNVIDGQIHHVALTGNEVKHTVYNFLGGRGRVETIPLNEFQNILGATGRVVTSCSVTINPDTGKTYLFVR